VNAQQTPPASNVSSSSSSSVAPTVPEIKPPAIIDPNGPQIGLQTSESLFFVAAALNSCGYDDGLEESDAVRLHVRQQLSAALASSQAAQEVHDKLCTFIVQHRLSDGSRDLAQYVSLALYLTPPPELTTQVSGSDLPPDSTQVMDILPLLRQFAQAVDLHQIWISNRPAYEEEVARLHDPLSKMVVETNAYLKTPATAGGGSRFLVVLEPLLAPGQVNARVYGSDYVIVASPSQGTIKMDDVRHTYLHYEVEPLLYARQGAMDRLLPVLKTISEAPLDYTYRADIVSLVIECMIQAIEARTMQTGIVIPKTPDNVRKADMEIVESEIRAAKAKDVAIRHERVRHEMQEGFVLTEYFYNRLARFETEPQSFKESIGEMVYGMDVPAELGSIKGIQFLPAGSADVVRRTPRQLRGLDLAELKLMKGDSDGAAVLAKQALDQHTADPGRADFILARVAALHGQMAEAQHDFAETIRLSKDPRMLAWSHIYLGRVYDIQEERQQAVTEYHAALTVRDGQADTKQAAEKGIKQAYVLPPGAKKPDDADDDDSAPETKTPPGSASSDPAADTPDTAPRPNVPPLSSIPGAAQATRPHS
jgi:tetratricopeptide (TPR) repeat protein